MKHVRSDWIEYHKFIEQALLKTFLELRRVPLIREVAEKNDLCVRTIKLHKPFIDLRRIPGITSRQIDDMSRKWQGKLAA